MYSQGMQENEMCFHSIRDTFSLREKTNLIIL